VAHILGRRENETNFEGEDLDPARTPSLDKEVLLLILIN
jgi:hypothetical protein